MNLDLAKRKPRRPGPGLVFCLAFAWFGGVTSAWTVGSFGQLDAPIMPWNTDGFFYENMALSLLRGEGYKIDFTDSDWRKRYGEVNQRPDTQGQYHWVIHLPDRGSTTMRAPGYPTVLAAIYSLTGWRWAAARVGGVVFVSLGLALFVTWLGTRVGGLASVVAGLTLAVDYSIMQAAGTIASESLAILLMAMTFVLVAIALERPSGVSWSGAGACFGLLALTRGNWNLGLALLLAACGFLLFPRVRVWLAPARFSHLACFLITCIVVAAPWWVRNCLVTGQFQPFGTAGANGLVAAYCDESLNGGGTWQPAVFHSHQSAVASQPRWTESSLVERECLAGRESMEKAMTWAKKNWWRLPELFVYRTLSHWGLLNPTVPRLAQIGNLALLTLGLVGCFLFPRPARKALWILLIVDAIVVVITWSHLGRYAIPVRPLIHLAASISVVAIFQWIVGRRRGSWKIGNPQIE